MTIDTLAPGWPNADVLSMERRVAPSSVSIAHAGEQGVRVRIIVSGWAYRYRMLQDGRRQILNVLLPGDTFGIETLFGQPAQASVRTAAPVIYLALSAADLGKSFEASPEFRRHLIAIVMADKAAMEDWLVRLGTSDAEERIAELLISLHGRLQRHGLAGERSFVLELTQQEMADMLGLHVIHLNRVLGRLRARKLVSISGKRVYLHDPEALAELAPPLSHIGSLQQPSLAVTRPAA